jgi:MFS superfamily sulfate permease-like transporter
LAGIAVEIVVRQVPTILGVPGGGSTTIEWLRQVAGQLSHTYGWTLGIALGVLAVSAAHLMVILDTTVIFVALPSVKRSLHLSAPSSAGVS